MDAQSRREQILNIISNENSPVSASFLAKTLNVSRQVIVGDIALIRSGGHEIIATARGYIIAEFNGTSQYFGKIACQHAPGDTQAELYAIVDLGAVVVNVIVEHNLYGEITGTLNLKSRKDVDIFIEKVENCEVKLLSELTTGVHLHTIACRDKAHFDEVCEILRSGGYLFSD